MIPAKCRKCAEHKIKNKVNGLQMSAAFISIAVHFRSKPNQFFLSQNQINSFRLPCLDSKSYCSLMLKYSGKILKFEILLNWENVSIHVREKNLL